LLEFLKLPCTVELTETRVHNTPNTRELVNISNVNASTCICFLFGFGRYICTCTSITERASKPFSYLQGQCGDKWYQHDGYCYFLSSNRLTWKNASNACVNVDANLVSIRNADENSFLSAFLMVQGKNADLIWIGGFSKDYVHRKWADESPWTFETFGAGEPDEADSCYAVYRFMWYDVSCGENAYPFVCKRRV